MSYSQQCLNDLLFYSFCHIVQEKNLLWCAGIFKSQINLLFKIQWQAFLFLSLKVLTVSIFKFQMKLLFRIQWQTFVSFFSLKRLNVSQLSICFSVYYFILFTCVCACAHCVCVCLVILLLYVVCVKYSALLNRNKNDFVKNLSELECV